MIVSTAARRPLPPQSTPLALLLSALLPMAALAQSASAPDHQLQPWQIAQLSSVASVHVAPDGNTAAYILSVQRKPLEHDSGPAWAELHLVELETGESRPYITGDVNVGAVSWSPDSRHIYFLAKREGDEQRSLYRIARAGGESEKLVEHETAISSYALGPGAQVAFLAADKQEAERKKLRDQGFDQKIYEEDTPFVHLFLADLTGDEKPERIEIEGSARTLRWSQQSDRFLVSSTPTPLVDDSYMKILISAVDTDGSESGRIPSDGKLDDFRLAPDGRHVAMISAADLNDPAAGRLMVARIDGSDRRELLPSFEGHVEGIAWRDSSTLIYTASQGAKTVVGSVGIDGEGARTLVAGGDTIASGLSVGASGKAALIGQAAQHPAEVFSLDLGSGGLRRLTDSNPWLDNVRLARQEVVTFEARDGLELEGILIRPLDEQTGKRYPLILIVHGGPESHYSDGWLTGYSQLGQLAAARGFAVFYPNYRGSTGRGVEFSKISQADAAGAEFDDLIDAVDHLIDSGLVDGDRVGITGGSYGGYASAWGTTYYSERFAAAIPFVGISNNISKVGTTDIPVEMNLVHHRKWLWEDWSYFAERSPIYYVKRNRTPTLILHGEDDPRVHPSQSLELYRHLKVLDQAPVRLVLYPGEGHGNRKSAARFDYTLRTLRWMEHYLKGPGGEPPPYDIDYAQHLPWAESGEESDD